MTKNFKPLRKSMKDEISMINEIYKKYNFVRVCGNMYSSFYRIEIMVSSGWSKVFKNSKEKEN